VKFFQTSLIWLSMCWLSGVADAEPARSARVKEIRSNIRDISNFETGSYHLDVRWNRILLENVGIRVSEPLDAMAGSSNGFDRFGLQSTSSLSAQGGYLVRYLGETSSLRGFSLRLRPEELIFDLVSGNGEVLFYADNAMAEHAEGGAGISISTMDVRISPRLAARLKRPDIAGWQVANMRLRPGAPSSERLEGKEVCPESQRWPGMPVPGHPGAVYQADIFMLGTLVQVTGCRNCQGPEGSGMIKISPTTILRNNVNDGSGASTVPGDPNGISTVRFAADIPWRSKFSKPCPPYGNDQHPFLVWNLYRWDIDGRLIQVARSGLKHGHVAANSACEANPGSNHVLGRGCEDVYGVSDNDAPDTLGPRSEVIPFKGLWGRCGSIYDPKCTGKPWDFGGYDDFAYRLVVPESEFNTKLHPGARYFFEAWYVVRDDVNPYNSMVQGEISLSWNADYKLWMTKALAPPAIGSAVDRWVDPQNPKREELTSEAVTQHGRIKLAVRTSALEGGRYRYDYALMNVDFAAAALSGTVPNLRVVSSHGLSAIAIPIASNAKPQLSPTAGASCQSIGPWTMSIDSGAVRWEASRGAELTWGSLCSFSVEASGPPARAEAVLEAGGGGPSQAWRVPTLVPEPERIR
jgi:hypothetical protein